MNVITTPNEPKILPFSFNGEARKNGEGGGRAAEDERNGGQRPFSP